MIKRLKAQGVNAANISTFDGGDDVGGKANRPKTAPPGSTHNLTVSPTWQTTFSLHHS